MHSKRSGRPKLNARKAAVVAGLRLLRAVNDGLLFFYGTYRYRRVAIGQGVEGLRRVVREQEVRAAAQKIRNFRRSKYLAERAVGSRRMLALTDRGRSMLLRLELRCAPKRRDGKCLIVAFDVPEVSSAYRKILRSVLRQSGFTRMQDSVWSSVAAAEAPLIVWIRRLNAQDWVRVFLAKEL